MRPEERWLEAVWPFVRDAIPNPASAVIEVGCGSVGGLVPALERAGHSAVGVDPEAPIGASYHRMEFESFRPDEPVDVVLACRSLHHVKDLDDVLDRITETLVPGGLLVLVEWAWERFDEATADWCFSRLAAPTPAEDSGWLHHHRDRWAASGERWDVYLRGWAEREGLYEAQQILRGMDARLDRRTCDYGPYLFAELADTDPADEQRAIDDGKIAATGVRYVARRGRDRPAGDRPGVTGLG